MRMNYLAVVVCAIVYWLLGGLWFDRLFSKQWMALEAYERSTSEFRKSGLDLAVHPHVPLESLDRICSGAGVHLAQRKHGRARRRDRHPLWFGIVGPIVYTTYMYEMRPMQLFAINEFYPLVGLCLMGGILGALDERLRSAKRACLASVVDDESPYRTLSRAEFIG